MTARFLHFLSRSVSPKSSPHAVGGSGGGGVGAARATATTAAVATAAEVKVAAVGTAAAAATAGHRPRHVRRRRWDRERRGRCRRRRRRRRRRVRIAVWIAAEGYRRRRVLELHVEDELVRRRRSVVVRLPEVVARALHELRERGRAVRAQPQAGSGREAWRGEACDHDGDEAEGAACSGATEACDGLTHVCCDSNRHGACITDGQHESASPPRSTQPSCLHAPQEEAQHHVSSPFLPPLHQSPSPRRSASRPSAPPRTSRDLPRWRPRESGSGSRRERPTWR